MEKYLHKAAADVFFRLALIVACLTLLGSLIILSLPEPQPGAVNYVDATRDIPPPDPLTYPYYSFFTTKRRHIFQYGQLNLVQRSYKRTAPALPPGPDVSGLSLMATMPGEKKSYAIISGINGGASTLVTLGQTVRESILVEIASNHVTLARNDQNVTLPMNTVWDEQAESLLSESGISKRSGVSYTLAVPADVEGKDGTANVKGLGVNLVPLTEMERKDMGLNSGRGLKVTRVLRKDTGLLPEDLLLAVSGSPVGSIAQVSDRLKSKIGKDVFLTIIRKGKPMNVNITLP
ncbi:PDZ domain-containing protein [Maridesulfovibrio sp.]|uniref:PDZ domain-containing protein n=1 Tax=Maridesulfovibrio sp. TaxID=2795000 RepID=UPI002A1881D5|nr:PDZ domain-containing protein [Maridesulfovibrio sp.]